MSAEGITQNNEDLQNEEVNQLEVILSKCLESVIIEDGFHQLIMSAIFMESSNNLISVGSPHLLIAENQMLMLASYPCCTDGILYAVPLIFEFEGNLVLYLRCFESGLYIGFFRTHWKELFKAIVETNNIKDCYIVNIFSNWDVQAAVTHRTTIRSGNNSTKNSKMFKSICIKNKTSLNEYLPIAYATFKKKYGSHAPGFVIFCQRMARHSKNINSSDNWYFKTEGLGEESFWEHTIKNYSINQNQAKQDIVDIRSRYSSLEILTLEQQFHVLSVIPNFHRWSAKKTHGVKKDEYFLPKGNSPRNKLMNCLLSFKGSSFLPLQNDYIRNILKLIIQKVYHIDVLPNNPVRRKSKNVVKRVQLESEDLLEHLGMTNEEFDSLKQQSRMSLTIYESFRKNLYCDGTILCRIKNEKKQVVVMNDYNSENGDFKFNDFVTVTRLVGNDSTTIRCTCETYKVLMSMVQLNYGTANWDGVSCCHCRVLKEIFAKFQQQQSLDSEHGYSHGQVEMLNDDVIAKKIKDCFDSVAAPVVVLQSTQKNVEKYAVRCCDDTEFVHVFRNNASGNVFVKCLSGICQTRFNKKQNAIDFFNCDNLCCHLTEFKSYMEVNQEKHELLINGLSIIGNPTHESDDDNQSELDENDEYEEDNEFENIAEINKKCFNEDTGMWSFYSPYGRKVNTNATDPMLIKNCIERHRYPLEDTDDNSGKLKFYPFYPSDVCQCDLDWKQDSEGRTVYELECNTTLYTKVCSFECEVYMLVCRNRNCYVKWNGVAENIFRLSGKTCIGEELCWEFVDMVSTMKCNFSAFCTFMTSTYARYRSKKTFMSPKTFIKLFFSWASNQEIDFRKVCQWCGTNPKILACDATRIGIIQKNCAVSPIEEKDNNENTLPTLHRRNNRCFLSYPVKKSTESIAELKEREKVIRNCRSHMKKIMGTLGGSLNQTALNEEQLNVHNTRLLDVCPEQCKPLLNRVLQQSNVTLEQLKSASRLFYLLSFDAPLRALLPSPILPFVEELINDATMPYDFDKMKFLTMCNSYSIPFSNFVNVYFQETSCDEDALMVIKYIFSEISSVHIRDTDAEPCQEIAGSYNPPKLARAYYFRENGSQLRKVRAFDIDSKSKNSTHDDAPSTSSCSKDYAMVAKKGTTFLFLWFCPLHGHCYGCHIVNGSEGRKDPACSLYSHLEVAPETIFYDFSCSLEEYCLNREAGYFKDTRFFHDIFHGFSHNCSPVYSSKDLHNLQSVNSSICEQFNSFLQCIKSSARQMSQEHFMFFTQYMINIWNEKKNKNFNNKLKIAISGTR